jgi:hypothetical protein
LTVMVFARAIAGAITLRSKAASNAYGARFIRSLALR